MIIENITNLINEINNSVFISEELNYHLHNNIDIQNSVFRFGSERYLKLVSEIRDLSSKNLISLNENDSFIVNNTDIGMIGSYNGKEIPLDIPFIFEEKDMEGHSLNKPFKTPGHPRKKYAVYTTNEQGNTILVRFGDPERSVKNCDPVRAKAFLKRMHCDNPGPKWKANWWSCNVGKFHKELGLQCGDPW
jgi:hypothetical protein